MHVKQSINDRLHTLVVLVRRERLKVPSDELPRLDRPNDLPPCMFGLSTKMDTGAE